MPIALPSEPIKCPESESIKSLLEEPIKCQQLINNALKTKNSDYFKLIHALKEGKLNNKSLIVIIHSLSNQISNLTNDHTLILKQLLNEKFINNDDVYTTYIMFLQNLVSCHATHSKAVVEMIIVTLRSGKYSFFFSYFSLHLFILSTIIPI
jgi:hypothetical protein